MIDYFPHAKEFIPFKGVIDYANRVYSQEELEGKSSSNQKNLASLVLVRWNALCGSAIIFTSIYWINELIER